jgi:hypothetical protein
MYIQHIQGLCHFGLSTADNALSLVAPATTAVWSLESQFQSQSQRQSYIATDGSSISESWCRSPSGAHDQIFIIVWQLQSCFCGAPSLTRGRVCLLYMLLVFARAVKVNSLSRILLHILGTNHAQKTQPFYCCMEQTTQKTRVTCQTASSLVRYQHWAWRGRQKKDSFIYCCVLALVYRSVTWQRINQIRYNMTQCACTSWT